LFINLEEELPHSLAVDVEEIEDRDNLVYIKAAIYINRSSQKMIVIGKNGSMLSVIGKASRIDIESIVNKKVYLDIWVKILKDWQKSPRILKQLGYWWG